MHAYGPADDVPALLRAVALGDDDARARAWWELWENVHHQGTVYEATVPAIPFLARVAAAPHHPDRVNAVSFLRQAAVGDGSSAPQVRAAVEAVLDDLLATWTLEPPLVQRALVLLASAFPDRLDRSPHLAAAVPERFRAAWDALVGAGGDPAGLDVDDDAVMDRNDELERWLLVGWNERGRLSRGQARRTFSRGGVVSVCATTQYRSVRLSRRSTAEGSASVSSSNRTSTSVSPTGTPLSTPSVPRASKVPVTCTCAPRSTIPIAVATERSVTPAHAATACSSRSPEHASEPSPPVDGCSPARAGPDQVGTVQ